jgi:NADPH-dependent 2,4-dienoyl-CoA reductase/sulfur reductase-like enzyme
MRFSFATTPPACTTSCGTTRGCRGWLRVTRDTLTHEIRGVAFANGGGRVSTVGVSRMPSRLAAGGLVDRGGESPFASTGALRRIRRRHARVRASGAGVRIVARSFKYHRPRGVFTAGSEEPNALVELRAGARREPNTRATVVELFDGLEASSQNRWPSLAFDVGAVNSLLSPVFVAGFYYKTFMWPSAWWEKLYEPAIRRIAGLGRASLDPDPRHVRQAYAFCDVLVIGAGPGGLAAALAAGRAGARMILCDEDFVAAVGSMRIVAKSMASAVRRGRAKRWPSSNRCVKSP